MDRRVLRQKDFQEDGQKKKKKNSIDPNMGSKKRSTQKNTRHHFDTAPSIAKKRSVKAKLLNQDLCSQLDKATGLAGATALFAGTQKVKPPKQEVELKKAQIEKTAEEDMMALMSMKL